VTSGCAGVPTNSQPLASAPANPKGVNTRAFMALNATVVMPMAERERGDGQRAEPRPPRQGARCQLEVVDDAAHQETRRRPTPLGSPHSASGTRRAIARSPDDSTRSPACPMDKRFVCNL
jgi:hypothetical protein